MSKTRDTGFLSNVVKYDANGNVSIVSGSTVLMSISSSGAITTTGVISGSAAANATSASYAANTSLLNGSGSGEFVPTGSFNTFSSSILSYTGSANSRLGSLETTSGSNITRIAALEVTSGSNITRISALETASGSAITRLSSLESKTGSYATTGSNTFVGGQYLSSSFNPTGFSTTASLYTDGGLRVTKDAYISGTLYLNNVTVYGTQSVAYITSSQLNIASNLITVNTATPSVQFGGLAVYDSGSSGLTGSILWDSTNNRWVYSNPSGSTYDGGMLISGPRNTSGLGNEVGTTACMLLAGQGGDHLTSSMIYHSSNCTAFYTNILFVTASGNVGINTTDPNTSLGGAKGLVINGGSLGDVQFRLQSNCTGTTSNDGGLLSIAADSAVYLWNYENADMRFGTCNVERIRINSGGCVGIGTTGPSYLLQVTSNSPSIMLEATGSTSPAYLRFNNTARSATNYIALGGSANDLFFTVNGSDKFFISGSGNIGIGTTTPTSNVNSTARVLTICGPSSFGSIVLNGSGTQEGGMTGGGSAAGLYFDISGDSIASANKFFFRAGQANSCYSVCTVATISNTGVACFASTVCTPLLSFPNGTGNKIDFYNDGITRYTAQINAGELRFYTCGTDVITLYAGNTVGLVNRSGRVAINSTSTDALFSIGDWCNRGGRLLTSNNAGWWADGVTPCSVITTNNVATCKGASIGLALHNDSQAISSWTPSLVFSRRSHSGGYNSAIATIQAQATGCGNDSNWVAGDLVFSTTPIGVGGYMSESMRIMSSGLVCTPNGVKFGSGSTSLNYFEEGCWQPRLVDSNSSTIATDNYTNAGRYTRVGNRVFFTFYSRFNLSGLGAGDSGFTANLRIVLPFTAASTTPGGITENFAPINISYWSSFYCLNSGDFPVGYIRSGENVLQLTLQNTACFGEFTFGTGRLTRSASAGVMISGNYYAA